MPIHLYILKKNELNVLHGTYFSKNICLHKRNLNSFCNLQITKSGTKAKGSHLAIADDHSDLRAGFE